MPRDHHRSFSSPVDPDANAQAEYQRWRAARCGEYAQMERSRIQHQDRREGECEEPDLGAERRGGPANP